MIKLIVSDLDGTLLNDEKILPGGFEKLLVELNRRGIMFATGSGRTYATQLSVFSGCGDTIRYICDNGAYIAENGEMSFVSIIDRPEWVRVVKMVEARVPEAVPILCGVKGTYCSDHLDSAEAVEVIPSFYSEIRFVDRLFEVEDEIFKLSFCLPYAAKQHLFPVLSQFCTGKITSQLTDPSFADVMNAGISKGSAVEFLQSKYNIKKSETMVFGDYYNDIEMLGKGEASYVMENAPIDMRAYGKYLAPGNNEGGVEKVIKKYLNSMKP